MTSFVTLFVFESLAITVTEVGFSTAILKPDMAEEAFG
jgi:hypothetical protein